MTEAEEYWKRYEEIDSKLSDREILEDVAVGFWIDPTLPTRKLIHEMLTWEATVALDPRVSKQASYLYHSGYEDGKAVVKSRY